MVYKIPLLRGGYTLVDKEDYDKYSKYVWYKNAQGRVVSVLKGKARPPVRLHRVIMNAPKGYEVDHINHNPLDNRRENLRICTHSQNMKNLKLRCDNSTGYRGVSPYGKSGKFRCTITCDGKTYYFNSFDTPEEAYERYKEMSKKLHGEYGNY